MNRSTFGQWLDFFRWTAAFVVLYGHTVDLFMVRISDVPEKKSIVHLAAAFPTGFAQQAVMIFFVISGLLVGGDLFNQWRQRGQVDAGNYLIKRLSRLWTVLLPIFLVTFLCNWIGLTFFPSTTYYRPDTWDTMTPASFLCNAAFLQVALCRPFGNNGPLWSLFHEFWYYIAWLGFVWALTRSTQVARLGWIALTLACLSLLTYLQMAAAPLAPYMLIWLLGVAVVWRPKPLIHSLAISAAILIVCLLAIRLGVRRDFWAAHPFWTFAFDFTAAGAFANLLLTMKHNRNLKNPYQGRLFVKLADFSFTLYCVHVPLLHLYGAAFDITRVRPDSISGAATICAPIVGIIFIAWLLSFATEKQTPRVRRFFLHIAGRLQSPRAAHSPPNR